MNRSTVARTAALPQRSSRTSCRRSSASSAASRSPASIAAAKAALAELLAPYDQYLAAVRDVLAAGWGVRGRRRVLLLAAVGHALDFAAWRSLARGQGLDDGRSVEVMVRMVRCVARE